MEDWKKRWEDFKEETIFDTRVDTDDNYPEEYNVYLSEYDTTAMENFISQELSKAREEGKKEAFTKDEWFMLKLAMNDIFNSGNHAYEGISKKIQSELDKLSNKNKCSGK